jgi:hypothetical protein
MSKPPNYSLNYVALPVLGFGLGIGIGLVFAYPSFSQEPAPAVAAKEPDSKPPAPAVAANAPDNNSAGKYTECVFETIKAQQAERKAARDQFARSMKGMSYRQVAALMSVQPLSQPLSERENFTLIKETCRLKFPCADDEVVSKDYNTCFKRRSR